MNLSWSDVGEGLERESDVFELILSLSDVSEGLERESDLLKFFVCGGHWRRRILCKAVGGWKES